MFSLLLDEVLTFHSGHPDKAGAFFGLFNTFGKAAAFIGPALIGTFLVIFKDTSLMLLPLLILFVLGIIVLYFVKTDEII